MREVRKWLVLGVDGVRGLNIKGYEEIFWGDGVIVYFVLGIGNC